MIALIREEQPHGTPAGTVAIFDSQSLLDRCMGEANAAAELLEVFSNRLPKTIAEICESLADLNDVSGVSKKIHILKGNAGNLSADRLCLAASRLEEAIDRQRHSDIPARLANLQYEAGCFLRALPSSLASLS